jgi:hypothetical protein
MSTPVPQFAKPFHFDRLRQSAAVNGTSAHLVIACAPLTFRDPEED